jgi:uncharacterized repeat protein (TIGR03847 family)
VSASFDLRRPDRFTAGTVGPPGQRVFYLQARQGSTVATLKAEKEQIVALADYLETLLNRMGTAPAEPGADLALLEPIAPAWAVGSIGVGYDDGEDRIVVVAEELREEDAAGEGATARLRVTRPQAAAFVERARALVKAGRPPCRLCGQPVDPTGHVCARLNGHHAREVKA